MTKIVYIKINTRSTCIYLSIIYQSILVNAIFNMFIDFKDFKRQRFCTKMLFLLYLFTYSTSSSNKIGNASQIIDENFSEMKVEYSDCRIYSEQRKGAL